MKIVKIFLPVILVMCLSINLSAQKQDSTIKVKSIIVYQEKNEPLVTRKFKESEQDFDLHGNLIEAITYKQGKIKKHFKYQYDSENHKIKEEEFDPSGHIIESSEYKYANGFRIEKTVYDGNKKLKSRRSYQYALF